MHHKSGVALNSLDYHCYLCRADLAHQGNKDRAVKLFILGDSLWWGRPEVMNSFIAGSCELAQHQVVDGGLRLLGDKM